MGKYWNVAQRFDGIDITDVAGRHVKNVQSLKCLPVWDIFGHVPVPLSIVRSAIDSGTDEQNFWFA